MAVYEVTRDFMDGREGPKADVWVKEMKEAAVNLEKIAYALGVDYEDLKDYLHDAFRNYWP